MTDAAKAGMVKRFSVCKVKGCGHRYFEHDREQSDPVGRTVRLHCQRCHKLEPNDSLLCCHGFALKVGGKA